MGSNRAQRRREQRKQQSKPRIVTFTQEAFQAAVDKEFQAKAGELKYTSTRYAADALTAVFALKLNQLYGFGSKRLETLLEAVNKDFNLIEEGYVELSDFIKEVVDTFGFDIVCSFDEARDKYKKRIEEVRIIGQENTEASKNNGKPPLI